MSDVLLNIIIVLVVAGVGIGVIKFCVGKWFPEWSDYLGILLMVVGAAVFIFVLIQIWPFLTGWGGTRSAYRQ